MIWFLGRASTTNQMYLNMGGNPGMAYCVGLLSGELLPGTIAMLASWDPEPPRGKR